MSRWINAILVKPPVLAQGELIKQALDLGVQHIILGIGGSATNDGGAGMLQALGLRLLDKNGQAIGFMVLNYPILLKFKWLI